MLSPVLISALFFTPAAALTQAGLASGAAVGHDEPSLGFAAFVEKHGRAYKRGSPEYELRSNLYAARASGIDKHNAKPGRRWTAVAGRFADWTSEELARMRGWKPSTRQSALRGLGHPPTSLRLRGAEEKKALPKEVSWAHLRTVSKVKDQLDCGSCWAVSSVLALEAHQEIYRHKAETLSAQQIVSCALNPFKCGGKGGCDGATAEIAMDYALRHGLAEDRMFPYLATDVDCPAEFVKDAAIIDLTSAGASNELNATRYNRLGMRGWRRIPMNTYENVMRALAESGPVVTAISSSDGYEGNGINAYDSGIYDTCQKNTVVDHAVVLIGYGEHGGEKYWLIQNSWGSDWGEGGRMRVLRRADDETECGTDLHPDIGTGCDGGPASVEVCGMCGILFENVVPIFEGSPSLENGPVILAELGAAERRR